MIYQACCRLGLLLVLVATFCSNAQAEPDLSKPVGAFEVSDFRGRVWTLDDFADSKFVVVAYLGTECPLAKLYAGRLRELEQTYAGQGVTFVGVMSNRQDSIAEISAYARKYEINFPLLKDAGNRLADAMGAERTPEVFVLDSDRMIRYWGRIDDQYGIGYVREAPTKLDLKNALDDLLAGKSLRTPITRSVGCIIGRQKATDSDASVTFSNQVARIFNRRCVECHREGEIGPFALSDYHEAAGWADMIAEVVREGRMPPWHANPEVGKFSNDRSLTEEEKQTLYAWADAGAPEGNANELPEPPEFLTGWQLPREPDMVIPMDTKPFKVKASGEVSYKYFRVDPKLTEDKWLESAELQPGNRAVVHHILCFVRPKGSNDGIAADRSFLVGYVPGARVEQYPEGMAKRIPANSELIFQVHYTPIGTPQEDLSLLGLVFADPEKITHELKTYSTVRTHLEIQPYLADQRFLAEMREREQLPESTLLAFSPHMHLRGKSFRYDLVTPGGDRQTLLDIPEYDFNWQTTYMLAEPLKIEAGSKIACEAVFDNSEKNLNNPDPSKKVGWGDQTDDEMLIGYFHYAVKLDTEGNDKTGTSSSTSALDPQAAKRLQIFGLLDSDGDGRVTVGQIPGKYRSAAEELDRDGDGVLTRQEVGGQ